MRRRQFIAGLGGVAAWPLAARAQQPDRMRRVGVLSSQAMDSPTETVWLDTLRQGLDRLGWVEGRNLQIDVRFPRRDSGALRTSPRSWWRCGPT
jgi:putative ABC transport system substrate-binding protein